MQGYYKPEETQYVPVAYSHAEADEIEENRRTSPNETMLIASLCSVCFAGVQSFSYLFYFFPNAMAVPSGLVVLGALSLPVLGVVMAPNARRKFRMCLLSASSMMGVIAGNASFVKQASSGNEVEALLLMAIAVVGVMAFAIRVKGE